MTQSTDFIEQLAALAEKATPGEGIFAHGNAELSNFLMHKVDAILALGRERDELREAANWTLQLLEDAPDINPSNYDHDQVCALNTACNAAWNHLSQALEGDNQ